MIKEKGIFLCENKSNPTKIYSKNVRLELPVSEKVYSKEDILNSANEFENVEYIFSGWGMPSFTKEEIKEKLPSLKAVFYGAGSVQSFAKEFLDSGIRVFSAWRANAVPVAEFTLAQILLATKGYFQASAEQSVGNIEEAQSIGKNYPGNFGATVGIIGVGMIGRMVIELLHRFSLNILAYDAFLSADDIADLGATKVSLEELFERCNVVSNHLANNTETVGMLSYDLFQRLMPYATFINTGRGAQVVEEDLVKILKDRSDITALLDVTYPEPPHEDHSFYKLKNCFLTPHIAGSSGDEIQRMGEYMLDAFRSVKSGKKTEHEVTSEMLKTMA